MSDSEKENENFDEERIMAERAQLVEVDSLPDISKTRYIQCYKDFQAWSEKEDIKLLTQDTILVYMGELKEKYSPNTLISKFSMLKRMIDIHHHINIGDYKKVTAMLNRNAIGYKPTKSKVFNEAEIKKFLDTAPDDPYLVHKVCTVIYNIFKIFHTFFLLTCLIYKMIPNCR